jgi:periplasmic divalent cation tolerance protein
MPESSTTARIVLTTAANSEEATRLGRTLVEERLAACATLIPAIESIYRWKGKIESSVESMLLLKTNVDQLPALETRLHALHNYETPEFLVLPIEAGSHAYLYWMNQCLSPHSEPDQSGQTSEIE